MQQSWYVFAGVAALVALAVYGCILWCVVAYHRERSPKPARFTGNPPIEILCTAVPLAIVAGLFVVTLHDEMPVDYVSAHPENRIAVTAFRWSWRFAYSGDRIVTTGTPLAPPTLYLPVNRTTEIALTTVDVNHSFWVPAFLFKRDAIPGMTNVFDITPNRPGTFLARCAQFCGLDHASMSFAVDVVSGDAYDRFIASNGSAKP